jgi:hypothetical protein
MNFKRLSLFAITTAMLNGCCKVDTSVKYDDVDIKKAAFDFITTSNQQQHITGKIYYYHHGEKVYVAGEELKNQLWNVPGTLGNPEIQFSAPQSSIVHYKFYLDSSNTELPALSILCCNKTILEIINPTGLIYEGQFTVEE